MLAASRPSKARSAIFNTRRDSCVGAPASQRRRESPWRLESAPTPPSSRSSTRCCSGLLPVADPGQLYFVTRHQPAGTAGCGHNEFRQLQAANPVFSNVAAYATTRLNVSIDGNIEPTAEGHLVSGSFFSAAGRERGRRQNHRSAGRPGSNGHPVAVLGYNYWKRRFGLDQSVVGRTISLSGAPFTIVGIAPPEFFGLEVGRTADIFVPVMMQPTVMPAAEDWLGPSTQRSFWLTVVGRLESDLRRDRRPLHWPGSMFSSRS